MQSVFATPEYDALIFKHRFSANIFVSALAGGRPRNSKTAEGWLRKTFTDNDDLIREAVAEVMAEQVERAQEIDAVEAVSAVIERLHLNGFSRDESGLYVHGYQLKACLKEAASIACNAGHFAGSKAWGVNNPKGFLGWFPEHVFVVEDRIPLGMAEPSSVTQTFPLNKRVGMRGIQYSEVVHEAKLAFTVTTDHDFSDVEWATIWKYAEKQGLGSLRSMGYGEFSVAAWAPIERQARRSRAKS